MEPVPTRTNRRSIGSVLVPPILVVWWKKRIWFEMGALAMNRVFGSDKAKEVSCSTSSSVVEREKSWESVLLLVSFEGWEFRNDSQLFAKVEDIVISC